MKVGLKIEAPGVQVYAYEINEETKALLEENAKNVFKESGIPEIDEGEKKRIVSANDPPVVFSKFVTSSESEKKAKN